MGDHYDMGMISGLLQNRGIDPGIVALLNDKHDGWGEDGGIWLVLLFLFLIGGNGFGFGNGNNIAGIDTNAVLNAVSTQGTRQEMAINNIANTLGCSFQNVQSALANVDKQLAVNQGSVINAIQSCCCNLQSAIDKCCCQTNLNIERTGNNIVKASADQSTMINDRFCQLELREKQNTIDSLRAKVLEQSQDAQTRILLDAIAGGGYCPFGGKLTPRK